MLLGAGHLLRPLTCSETSCEVALSVRGVLQLAKAAQYSGEQQLAYDLYTCLTTMELSNKKEQYVAYQSRGVLAQRKGDQLQALYDLSIAASLKRTQWEPLMTRSKAYRALHDDSAAAQVSQSVPMLTTSLQHGADAGWTCTCQAFHTIASGHAGMIKVNAGSACT